MNKILTGGLAALTLGGVVLGGVSQASARDWDHHDDDSGAAIAAGIAGLAVGAALAGGHRGYYAPAPAYYGPPAVYYERPAYYGYRRCHGEWRWSRYWGRYERVRACY